MTVLITGAAVRLGRAISIAFAEEGHKLILHYNKSQQAAEELFNSLGAEEKGHSLLQCDLLDVDKRQTLIAQLYKNNLQVDCLINNASTYFPRSLKKLTRQELLEDYEINFFAPFCLMQQMARNCKKGLIINMLDYRVKCTDHHAGSYGFAKKSLRDATEAAALAWAPHLRVNAVAPGAVLPAENASETAFHNQVQASPLKRATALQEITKACLFFTQITQHLCAHSGAFHRVSLHIFCHYTHKVPEWVNLDLAGFRSIMNQEHTTRTDFISDKINDILAQREKKFGFDKTYFLFIQRAAFYFGAQ